MAASSAQQLNTMKTELEVAADFFVHLITTQRNIRLTTSRITAFREALVLLLSKRFLNHWFLDNPSKGCGYRCIHIHHNMDPLLMDTAAASGFSLRELRQVLPPQFTMWVDPGEVSIRFGEHGSTCVLYESKKVPDSVVNSEGSEDVAGGGVLESGDSSALLEVDPPFNNTQAECSMIERSVLCNSVNLDVLGSCKESLRQVDFYLDQRGSSNFETVTQYVSS